MFLYLREVVWRDGIKRLLTYYDYIGKYKWLVFPVALEPRQGNTLVLISWVAFSEIEAIPKEAHK